MRTLTPAGGGRVWTWLGQVTPGQNRLTVMDASGELASFDLADPDEPDVLTPMAGAPDGSLWFAASPYLFDARQDQHAPSPAWHLDRRHQPGPTPGGNPHVTSMAFDADGVLWYTTYRFGTVTLSGDRGGGIGRWAAGRVRLVGATPYPEPFRTRPTRVDPAPLACTRDRAAGCTSRSTRGARCTSATGWHG